MSFQIKLNKTKQKLQPFEKQNNFITKQVTIQTNRHNQYIMASKYKYVRINGFDPFKKNMYSDFESFIKQKQYDTYRSKNINEKNKLKQIAILLKNNASYKQKNQENDNELILQNYQIHKSKQINEKQNHQQNKQKLSKQKLILFNQKEYFHKKFNLILDDDQNSSNERQIVKQIFSQKTEKAQQSKIPKLLIYLSNTASYSDQLISGNKFSQERFNFDHNQTFKRSQQQKHDINNNQCLINSIWRQISQRKCKQNKSHIYLSIIGIQRQNQLIDLLNRKYLQQDYGDRQSISQESLYSNLNKINDSRIANDNFNLKSLNKKVPPIKIRKITSQGDSIQADNLSKIIVDDQNQLKETLQTYKQIKNHFQYYYQFNSNYMIGQLFHIYQMNDEFQVVQNVSVLKLNQHFPRLNSPTFEYNGYERKNQYANSSRLGSLIMRIGINIKNSIKNVAPFSNKKVYSMNYLDMHESKILLYMSQFFKNLFTNYIIINQIGSCQHLNQQIKNLSLNINCKQTKNQKIQFQEKDNIYIKHYLDSQRVLKIVKNLSKKYNQQSNINKRNISQLSEYKRQAQQVDNENDELIQRLQQKRKSSHSYYKNRSISFNKQKISQKYNNKVNNKSFYGSTLSSSQRNYLKLLDRRQSQEIRALLSNAQFNQSTIQYNRKNTAHTTVTLFNTTDPASMNRDSNLIRNQQVFIDQNKYRSPSYDKLVQGRKVSYKRKLTIKQVRQIQQLKKYQNQEEIKIND